MYVRQIDIKQNDCGKIMVDKKTVGTMFADKRTINVMILDKMTMEQNDLGQNDDKQNDFRQNDDEQNDFRQNACRCNAMLPWRFSLSFFFVCETFVSKVIILSETFLSWLQQLL